MSIVTTRAGAAATWLAAAVLWVAFASVASAQVPTPTVTGPIAAPDIPGTPTRNYIFFAANQAGPRSNHAGPLAEQGYTETEYFFSGSAHAYAASSALATATVVAGPYPYMTRMVVREPADKRRFNGVVLVEWYNVTNGFDAENLWFYDWEHILGQGYVWIGVSAQTIGVNTLTTWNPGRYGSLNVGIQSPPTTVTDPDALSYDIFSQAGEAIRNGAGNVLNGLKPKLIIATGESQSAFRLANYVNNINPLGNVYDGFLMLSTIGQQIRPDLTQPVFKVLTEYDVQAAEASIRQPNTSKYRSWEIAGQSHVDQHLRDSREAAGAARQSTGLSDRVVRRSAAGTHLRCAAARHAADGGRRDQCRVWPPGEMDPGWDTAADRTLYPDDVYRLAGASACGARPQQSGSGDRRHPAAASVGSDLPQCRHEFRPGRERLRALGLSPPVQCR
jgi:hypothetical protein